MSPHSAARVVVVGAGLSGLSAASTLVKAGFQHIQVLEAMGRPGGRVYTTRPFGQNVIELGANWIHGQEANPLFLLAQEQGLLLEERGSASIMCLPGSVTPRDYFFRESRRQLPVDEVEQVCSFFSGLTSRAFESELEPRHSSQSLGGYLDEEFAQSPLAALEDGPRVFEWCKRSECTDEASSSLYEVSASQLGHYVALEGGFFNSLGPGGYQALADTLLDNLPPGALLCDRPVHSIHWALRFEDRFWPHDCAGIQLVWDAGPEDEEVYQHSQSEGGAWRDMWYKKICGFDTVARHPTVLCGWITGREAKHMESSPN